MNTVTVSFKEIEGTFIFDSGLQALNFATDNELTFLFIKEGSVKGWLVKQK